MTGLELARRLARGTLRVGVLANLVGAVVLFFALVIAGGPPGEAQAQRFGEMVGLLAILLLVGFPSHAFIVSRFVRPFIRALEQGRPIAGEARRRLFLGPWSNASVSLAVWGISGITFAVHAALRLDAGVLTASRIGLSILLGGLTTLAIVYLSTERVFRPAFALAFEQDSSGHSGHPFGSSRQVGTVAVGPRLLLAWVLGAGVPLVLIGSLFLDPAGPGPDSVTARRIVLALVAAGIAAGVTVTLRAARSVSEPLNSVREGMASVATGRLDVNVEVYDATEIGLLQAGFNHMVSGLRERGRLQDLFGRHVGEAVARRALERGVELGGEVREASAVFVDLIGSTALGASYSPREVVELLNNFFQAVVRVADTEEGWVNKFEGDAALCVFGVPVPLANHAEHALCAARTLRTELEGLRKEHPELDAGIGVSTGSVLAGNVGAENRYEYTVIGGPVNEAARLADEAKQRVSRVLTSGTTLTAAGSEAGRWKSAGMVQLRGFPSATNIHEPA
jgi:adenylate cyclase